MSPPSTSRCPPVCESGEGHTVRARGPRPLQASAPTGHQSCPGMRAMDGSSGAPAVAGMKRTELPLSPASARSGAPRPQTVRDSGCLPTSPEAAVESVAEVATDQDGRGPARPPESSVSPTGSAGATSGLPSRPRWGGGSLGSEPRCALGPWVEGDSRRKSLNKR